LRQNADLNIQKSYGDKRAGKTYIYRVGDTDSELNRLFMLQKEDIPD
jgi:hypothetical protein